LYSSEGRLKGHQNNKSKHYPPPATAKNRHRLARLAQTQLKALTMTEAGAAGSFWYSFDGKRKVTLSAAIPEINKR